MTLPHGPEPCFIDFHCHLEHHDFDGDLDAVVARAKAAGVHKALCAGSNLGENRKIIALLDRFPGFLDAVIGTSPHDASSMGEAALKEEIAFVRGNIGRVCGIGEVGLDHHHFTEFGQWARQEEILRAYLSLAEEHSLPVVVHSRKAEERCFEVIGDFPKVRVMMHCFLKPKLALEAAKMGWLVSLPTLKGRDRDKIASTLPLENIAAETDSPFLWKDPATGNPARNEPANVVESYQAIALARGEALEGVKFQLYQNYLSYFHKDSG